jgi:uncharacterized integral membrane protein (TIGR00698 family)
MASTIPSTMTLSSSNHRINIVKKASAATRSFQYYHNANNNNNHRHHWTFASQRYFSSTPAVEQQSDEQKKDAGEKKPQTTTATSTSSIVPGIMLSAATAAAGFAAADLLSSALTIPISGIPVSILFGLALNNFSPIDLPSKLLKPGIAYSTKTILQTGIVAVAAKLSFVELMTTGTAGLPVVVASVGAGLTLIPMYGRLAGLPKEMSLLLTAGTSICGVTAITALAPAISASNRDIAVAVANTVAFGTVGMLCYPYLFNALCVSSEQVGMCLGVGIHDTSQVLGSAMAYKETFDDETALKVAAITKLTRNLGLAFAIPGLTYMNATMSQAQQQQQQQQKEESATTSSSSSSSSVPTTMSGLNTFSQYVPPFLYAFIGMSCLRSTGDLLLPDYESYQQIMNFVGNDISKYALGTAMAGVGLSTSTSSLKGVGWKPFAVGAAGALTVGTTGFVVASLVA